MPPPSLLPADGAPPLYEKGIPENSEMELLDAKQVKQILRCSLPLVYKMAERGQLPCVRWVCPGKDGGRPKTMVRFKQDDVYKFIEEHYAQP